MRWQDLTVDIQIEIFKYKPFFRRINKTFYHQGKHAFNQLYGLLPISTNEFIKHQTHFHGTIFKQNDYLLEAIYLRNNNKCELRMLLNNNPVSISSRFYCSGLNISKNPNIHFQYDNYDRMVKNMKSLSNRYNPSKIIYDLQSTIQILKNRQCLSINQQLINHYLDSLFVSNGSDFDNMNTKLQYILYLASPEDLLIYNITVNYIYYNEQIKNMDENYWCLKDQIDQLYNHYYHLAINM